MKRGYLKAMVWMVIAPVCFGGLLWAQQTPPATGLQQSESNIRAELEGHGDRNVGQTYQWNTRLESISNCRAALKVIVTSEVGAETKVRTNSVSFSLGALESRNLDVQKSWLVLPCAGHEKCVSTISNCTVTTKEGFVIDCTSVSQTREDSYLLQLDGDSGAATRLKEAFREAIEICRTPAGVTF
jgi:hypothetical protein